MARRDSIPSLPEGPAPPSEPDYDSDYYSPSDDLADLMKRYTVTVQPEYFVKLRKQAKAVVLGGNYCFGRRGRYCTFSVKPTDRKKHSFLYKLATSPADAAVRLSTNKMALLPGSDLLKIQLNFEYNWATQAREVWWKITSKWSAGTALSSKEKYRLREGLQLWPHWRMNVHLPEVEGRLGGADPDVTVDKGYCHISVPKVVLRASLDDLLPARRRQRSLCPVSEQPPAGTPSPLKSLPQMESWPVVPPATNNIQVGQPQRPGQAKRSCCSQEQKSTPRWQRPPWRWWR